MSHRISLPFFAAALLFASAAQADALADLRATLSGLHADKPLAATLSVHSTTHSDEDNAKVSRAQVQVSVASGADGLHLGFSPKLLERADQEAGSSARDKDAPTPIKDLLDKLNPVNVQPMVDFAPALLHDLEGVTLASERDEVHGGKPSHLLVFDIPLPESAGKKMSVKHYTGQLKVWLDADGVPLATKKIVDVKGRKLLISIAFSTNSNYALRLIGTRLVAVSRHVEEKHSVFGHAGDTVIDATLSPVSPSS